MVDPGHRATTVDFNSRLAEEKRRDAPVPGSSMVP
ncbi:hypothetical protein T11_16571 [Trichinella zimbabwensis]|uniref:Uncharacterized protein n=1 Tax=Trichinella zimbabwensis TaxID=268475 RepID=A0A0V1GX68_9BILA|nr:hypothetical protein T11_16571 [Trichinella zimbabwensis]